MDDLVIRAMQAWKREQIKTGAVMQQPSIASSVVEHEGKRYVVLDVAGGIVYRVQHIKGGDRLKRLVRPPKELIANKTT